MKVRIIDDQNFPSLETAEAFVHELMQMLGNRDKIALYVMAEASQHGLFDLLSEEVYKISGHEEDDGIEDANS